MRHFYYTLLLLILPVSKCHGELIANVVILNCYIGIYLHNYNMIKRKSSSLRQIVTHSYSVDENLLCSCLASKLMLTILYIYAVSKPCLY